MNASRAPALNPEGMYAHAKPPPGMPISMAVAVGPYLVLSFVLSVMAGVNSALLAVYLHLFGGRSRDPWILKLAVLVSVGCNVSLALYAFVKSYTGNLFELYSETGYDVNKIDVYVIPFHTLQGIAVAIGQTYFALRISKLFDPHSMVVRLALSIVLIGIAVQLTLINWFGAAFYAVGFKTHLLDPAKQRWVRAIINSWTVVYVLLDLSMVVTTVARLMVLWKQTSMDHARKVIFRLAIYSVQGQVLMTVSALSSLYLFSRSQTGWYTPMYLLSGALYTMVMLSNLIYRKVVAEGMKQAHVESQEMQPTQGKVDSLAKRPHTMEPNPKYRCSALQHGSHRVEQWQQHYSKQCALSRTPTNARDHDCHAQLAIEHDEHVDPWQSMALANAIAPTPLLPLARVSSASRLTRSTSVTCSAAASHTASICSATHAYPTNR